MLARLGFDIPLGTAVLGLCVLFVVYFILTLVGLHVSRTRFIALGFQGAQAKILAQKSPESVILNVRRDDVKIYPVLTGQ